MLWHEKDHKSKQDLRDYSIYLWMHVNTTALYVLSSLLWSVEHTFALTAQRGRQGCWGPDFWVQVSLEWSETLNYLLELLLWLISIMPGTPEQVLLSVCDPQVIWCLQNYVSMMSIRWALCWLLWFSLVYELRNVSTGLKKAFFKITTWNHWTAWLCCDRLVAPCLSLRPCGSTGCGEKPSKDA